MRDARVRRLMHRGFSESQARILAPLIYGDWDG